MSWFVHSVLPGILVSWPVVIGTAVTHYLATKRHVTREVNRAAGARGASEPAATPEQR